MARSNTVDLYIGTLSADVNPTDVIYDVDSTSNDFGEAVETPAILVFEPRSATNREVVLADGVFTATRFRSSAVAKRYLKGSAAGSGLTHASGTEVWAMPVALHLDDLWVAIEANETAQTDHAAVTSAHSATAAATANRIVLRDANGRAKFADPSVDADAATKGYVDTAAGASLTTIGDLLTHNGTVEVRLAAGTDGQVPTWQADGSIAAEDAPGVGSAVAVAESVSTVTVVNTVTETALISQAVASLAAGEMLRLTAIGDYLNNSGSGAALTVKVRLGTTDMLTGSVASLSASAARRKWRLDVVLFAETAALQRAGANLDFSNTNAANWFGAGATGHLMRGYGTGAEDTTTSKTLQFRVAHDAANANLDVQVHAWKLEKVPAA